MLHLNSLNAAIADRMLKIFKGLNYKFVSLAEAQSDPAYKRSPAFAIAIRADVGLSLGA